MKKAVIGILVVVLLFGLGAWYFTAFRLDGVIENAIEKSGSDALGTRVSVGSLKTDLKNGSLTISNVTVANPPGFNNANALSLSGIEAAVNYENFDVTRVVVDKPDIVIEEVDGQTNFSVLMENMNSGADSSDPEDQAEEAAEEPTLVIHLFRMNESRAAFESPERDHYSNIEIDAVEVRNIRGTPAEVSNIILQEILEEVISEAATELIKAKASEKLGEILGKD